MPIEILKRPKNQVQGMVQNDNFQAFTDNTVMPNLFRHLIEIIWLFILINIFGPSKEEIEEKSCIKEKNNNGWKGWYFYIRVGNSRHEFHQRNAYIWDNSHDWRNCV